jgi:putative ATP-dependent endonuclease of the OLD family
MRIRRVDIQNYRGIKRLTWLIPPDQSFMCIIGPGDSAKSTILEAINITLSDRWSLALSDTDFHNADINEPITIRITLTDLPDDIIRNDVLGFELSGIMPDGTLLHDPEDDSETCIVVQLKVENDLEPQWTLYREGGSETPTQLRSGMRRKFSAFKVDERIDGHLRWTRTSALGRITETTHGAAGTLAHATRMSRLAVAESVTDAMKALTEKVRDKMQALGSGGFSDLQPGLDTSLSSTAGVLALFEGDVPLTNYGLGSKRLAGLATQQLAYEHRTIVLIDEVEYGLEPHRLVYLLNQLRESKDVSQIFVTTHSPVAVEQLDAADLAVVRWADGVVNVHMLRESTDDIQPMLRAKPSAFLARKVVLGEGRTEYGLLATLVARWDAERVKGGKAPAAALGAALVHGDGGQQTAQRAIKLIQVGYESAILVDCDDPGASSAIADAEAAGAGVVRWGDSHCTESALCAVLDAEGLTALVQLGTTLRASEATVRDDLTAYHTGRITHLDVSQWIQSEELDLAGARQLVGQTAKKREWFKSIPNGEALGEFIWTRIDSLATTDFGAKLGQIKQQIYGMESTEPDA